MKNLKRLDLETKKSEITNKIMNKVNSLKQIRTIYLYNVSNGIYRIIKRNNDNRITIKHKYDYDPLRY